jgi:hypothetical protein
LLPLLFGVSLLFHAGFHHGHFVFFVYGAFSVVCWLMVDGFVVSFFVFFLNIGLRISTTKKGEGREGTKKRSFLRAATGRDHPISTVR